MRNLPPLNGLRAFEAAARCGSFVLAGQELGVSSAAVSLQVKSLEEHLGKKLFLRNGNRISLTDAGEEIYPTLARAFREITETAQIMRNNKRARQLVISVLPSLSELWLLPKITKFKAQTGVSLDIRVEADPIDFARDAVDIRFTYGSKFYSDFKEVKLFSDVAIPVCAPSLWEQFSDTDGTLENIPDAMLIHNKWGPSYSSEPRWTDWRLKAQSKMVEFSDPGFIISDTSLAISLARQGAGICLVPSRLVATELTSEVLMSPSYISLPMKKDYVCIFPNARAEYPVLQVFLEFLGLS